MDKKNLIIKLFKSLRGEKDKRQYINTFKEKNLHFSQQTNPSPNTNLELQNGSF